VQFKKALKDNSGNFKIPEYFHVSKRSYTFSECSNYAEIKNNVLVSLANSENIDIKLLLFGKDNLSNNENEEVFLLVQNYIQSSKRF